ncbi:MAG: dephospho-CoA kinase [Bacteroidota bacterium]
MNRLQIGVTGGIGSGKSLVCKIFSDLHVPTYDADSRARWLMNNQPDLKSAIQEGFGSEAYTRNGEVNRAHLADKVFNDADELARLNALVHPAVGDDYKAWQEKQLTPYAIKEAALLFESGSYKELDYVVNVSAPEALRVLRVLDRDSFRSKAEIQGIIEKQLSEDERLQRSDFVIVNDGVEMIIPQVLSLHNLFLKGEE